MIDSGCLAISRILESYEKATGQQVNFNKSDVCFSPNMDADAGNSIYNLLMVREVSNHSKFLELSTVIGLNKKKMFGFLKERIRKQIYGWMRNFI